MNTVGFKFKIYSGFRAFGESIGPDVWHDFGVFRMQMRFIDLMNVSNIVRSA